MNLRRELYVIIFGTHTKAGRVFDISLILLILSSIFILIVDSIDGLSTNLENILNTAELIFTIFFLIEYILRIYCSPKPLGYIFSFYGLIDLCSVLPGVVAFFIPQVGFFGIIRLLRVMRIFRILKLVRFLRESNVLLRSFLSAKRKIAVFFSTVFVIVTIIGTIMYLIEGAHNGFTSIPKSMYWAIVTITTVGYGDMSPQTDLGQAIASITMLLGYSILAIPTGIYTAELHNEMQMHKLLDKCPNCQKSGHEADAIYCKYCGVELPLLNQRIATENNNE